MPRTKSEHPSKVACNINWSDITIDRYLQALYEQMIIYVLQEIKKHPSYVEFPYTVHAYSEGGFPPVKSAMVTLSVTIDGSERARTLIDLTETPLLPIEWLIFTLSGLLYGSAEDPQLDACLTRFAPFKDSARVLWDTKDIQEIFAHDAKFLASNRITYTLRDWQSYHRSPRYGGARWSAPLVMLSYLFSAKTSLDRLELSPRQIAGLFDVSSYDTIKPMMAHKVVELLMLKINSATDKQKG